MSTKNNSVIARNKQDVTISSNTDKRTINEVITHNDTILTFDMYRSKNGGRGIWGRKIFFQALSNLSFVENSKDGYKPTEEAKNKYDDFFVFVDNTWGFDISKENEIDDTIHKPLRLEQNRLMELHHEEKKEKAKIAREKAKRKTEQNKKVKGLF